MRTRVFLTLLFVCSAMFAYAEEVEGLLHSSASSISQSGWNTSPAYWDRVIGEQSKSPKLRIGGTDFAVGGSLIRGLRRHAPAPDRRLGRRILSLPIVRVLVPQPIPYPPGGGKYFRWGESDRPWVSIAEASGGAGADNPVNHESKAVLFSIGR